MDEDAAREKEPSFKTKQKGHTLLSVADLIHIAGVASKSDLTACLKALRCESARKTLDRHLAILQSVGFIEQWQRSNKTFYVRNSSYLRDSSTFIRYAYLPGPQERERDVARSRFLIRQHFDSNRKEVYRELLKSRSSNV